MIVITIGMTIAKSTVEVATTLVANLTSALPSLAKIGRTVSAGTAAWMIKRSSFKNVLCTKYAGEHRNYTDHNERSDDKFTNKRDCRIAINSNAWKSCLLQNDANVNQRKWSYQYCLNTWDQCLKLLEQECWTREKRGQPRNQLMAEAATCWY